MSDNPGRPLVALCMTSIPVIDVAPLPEPGGRGVKQSVVDDCFAASHAFHSSPLTKKQAIAINGFHRGYMGLATSTVVTSTVARNTKPNLSESVLVMHEVAPDAPQYGRP